MEPLFTCGELSLAGHLARPRTAPGTKAPAVIISHGFPTVQRGRRNSGLSFPELADRMANEMGWYALAYNSRGCGQSAGDFSIRGWLDDLLAAVAFVRTVPDVRDVWLVGFGTGGALSICAAAHEVAVRGVASVASPADFDDWAGHPRRLLQHARELGIVSSQGFPSSVEAWSRELREVRPVACATGLSPRPLLVLHGAEDDAVPVFDARVLADAHGGADLRIIDGGGHQLRHDPRAVAVLLGWLDRQRSALAAPAPP